MKIILLFLIRLYQLFVSPFQILFPTSGCRFQPTCSEYAYHSIKRHGAVRGLRLGILRVLKCNPWT